MKILVFGAGAVGSVVGGFLARMGHDVALLGRPWHLDTIAKKGLHITGIWGDCRSKALELFTDVGTARDSGPFDLIILTVKSPDTEKAAAELLPMVGEETVLLSLQNGLGNIEALLKTLPADNVLAGRVIFGAEILEPSVVKVTVSADAIVMGPAARTSPKNRSVEIAHLFSLAKLEARAVQDVRPAIWSKVIYNCALNPICTLRRIPYGKILEDPESRSAMERVVRECYEVGTRKGVDLEPPTADAYLKLLVSTLIPRTAAHYPSMLQDLDRGKRTDIEALNGAISRLASEFNIPAPENSELTRKILELSRQN